MAWRREKDEIDSGWDRGDLGGGGGLGGGPGFIPPKWLDITWSFTEGEPAGLLTGFEVGVVNGTTPETDPWILEPVLVPAAERRMVASAVANANLTSARGAVRPVFGDKRGPWTVQGVAQTVSKEVVPVATQVGLNAASAAAAAAQSTADAASSAASAAQSSANTANAALSDIASDGKLTPVEKRRARLEWDTILAERSGIQAQADTFGVSRTAYDAAFQALANYLNAGTAWASGAPSWLADANLGTTTTIVGSTFRDNWKALYDARQALLNAVADKARQNAAAAQSTANTATTLARQSGNIIKNGNSEDTDPTGYEAAGINATPGYARNGSKCRTILTGTAYAALVLTPRIPCSEGDEFYFEGWAKSTSGTYPYTPRLLFRFISGTGTTLLWVYDARSSLGTTWQKLSASGVAPAGTVAVEFCVDSGATVVPGGLIAWDDFYAERKQASAIAAQDTANGAQTAASYADALARSSYNLIKNGNSEETNPSGPEALLVSTARAYTGTKARNYTAASAGTTIEHQVSGLISCVPGDQFYMEAMVYQVAASVGRILMLFLGADKTTRITAPASAYTSTVNAWHKHTVSGTAPANAAFVVFILQAVNPASGTTTSWDTLYATRKVAAGMLEGDAIQTSNYAEDGSGNPTAGARMDLSGTSLKVMPGGLKVGSYVFTDYFWRILQALDGGNGTKVLYRGNNDTGTRGGAPDIARLTVTRRRWNTTDHVGRLELKIQPTGASDNLDAMRAAEVKLYRQSAAGTSATLTLVDTYYPAITDRYYRNTTDSDASNAVKITFDTVDPAISAGYPAALITLFNAYGPSAGNCFYSAYTTDGSPLTNSGQSWPVGITGGTSGGGGGGTGDLGGGCPAPWVRVQLASGLWIEAGDLHNGAELASIRETDGEPVRGVVRDLATIWAERFAVILEDGRAPEFSRRHRLATVDRGWVEVQNLQPGELLVAQQESRVRAVRRVGLGQVVTFRVEGAGTYFADGILQHNAKPIIV